MIEILKFKQTGFKDFRLMVFQIILISLFSIFFSLKSDYTSAEEGATGKESYASKSEQKSPLLNELTDTEFDTKMKALNNLIICLKNIKMLSKHIRIV